jgi:hypothetical protein
MEKSTSAWGFPFKNKNFLEPISRKIHCFLKDPRGCAMACLLRYVLNLLFILQLKSAKFGLKDENYGEG